MIGAGWIGSEVAASARQMGAEVVLIDPAPAPLHRVLGDEIGEVFCRLHADHGVQLRLRTGVAELRGRDTVEQVVLSDGESKPPTSSSSASASHRESNWPPRPA